MMLERRQRNMDVLLGALALPVGGGIAALLVSKSPRAATFCGVGSTVLGCALGLIPALAGLAGGRTQELSLSWDPAHGCFHVGLDPLSAFFLVPIFGLSALAAIYGGGYLCGYRHEKSLGWPWFFFNLFVAGMALVVLARSALLFLLAWEIMSVAAYFLVTFEQERPEVRQAGWIYLIATHLGVAFLFALFTLLGHQAGSLDFAAFAAMAAPDPGWASLLFGLALVGFGTKAGLVPLHVWLPEAHPAAPSHVSALMSGVMIKMGLYGLLRVLTFLGAPALWWGPTLAGLGLLTALFGIGMALHQSDLKRTLAYSSVENMGLMVLALGIGLWGLANALPVVAALGLTAALLHIWNHALMKGLLFLADGSVVHATGTKHIEQLGGLMKRMPWTGSALMLGSVAIAALPPLNGFVGKWLMYLGLLNVGLGDERNAALPALLAVGLLALVGGLAAIAFVRLAGVTLLGTPRSEAAAGAHESSWWLRAPMMTLLALCFFAALLPQVMANIQAGALDQVLGSSAAAAHAALPQSGVSLLTLGLMNALILASLGLGSWVLVMLTRKNQREGPTWGCGYLRPTARIQYTGRSFAELAAEHLLPRLLRPRVSKIAPEGLFPGKATFRAESPDPASQKLYEPLFQRCAKYFARLYVLQQGRTNIYLIYIMVTVVLALAWVSWRTWWGPS
jgi:formate hydrogenlyase subunit 3/multisubunit Na+/H+ antiporter MnhD subunit